MAAAPTTPRSNRPLPALWIIPAAALLAVATVVVLSRGLLTQSPSHTANTGRANLNTVAPGTTFADPALGFQLILPPGWHTATDHAFKADVVFEGATTDMCGCAAYITREDNASGLSIEDWLNADTDKKGEYMSQREYDRRHNVTDPTARILAGTYEQHAVSLGGAAGLYQDFQTEGGGYLRYLIAHDAYIFAVTLHSDSHYFADREQQTRTDGGAILRDTDQMIQSFKFL